MAGVNELDLARRLLDVPGPDAGVVAAGQARLDALIAAGITGQPAHRRRPQVPGRRRLRAPGRRRPGARWRLAAACAAVVTAAAVTAAVLTVARPDTGGRVATGHATMPGGRPGHARPPALQTPALQTAAVQAAVLASVTSAGGDVLYIQRSDGQDAVLDTREWFWPSNPAPGQQVRMLAITADGMEIENSFYATPRDQYTAGSAGPVITGTQLIIDPRAKAWSIQQGTTIRPQLPQATSAALLRQYIAAHVWTVIGRSSLAGQPAIELGTAGPNGLRELLWVNARTDLPMRQLKENWNGPGSTLQYDIEYLPATPANLAKLTPAIPPGYKRVPPL
jgi:hypothetical protein